MRKSKRQKQGKGHGFIPGTPKESRSSSMSSRGSNEERLSGVEENVRALNEGFDRQGKMMERIREEMHSGFDRLGSANNIQWSPLIAAAGLVLVIAFQFGSAVRTDLDRLEKGLGINTDNDIRHQNQRGHADTEARIDSLIKTDQDAALRSAMQIDRLEKSIQLWNDELKSDSRELLEKSLTPIVREIGIRNDQHSESMRSLEEQISEIRGLTSGSHRDTLLNKSRIDEITRQLP